MESSFLSLPQELRLEIYNLVFGQSHVVLGAKRRGDDDYSLLPRETAPLHDTCRSSQLLRVCRTIYCEAQPLLYGGTRFHILAQAFAGKLPCTVTNGHPAASHIQHLTWQLDCDLLKHFYPEDVRLDPVALAQVRDIELRCRAETWRNSFMGEWCDREDFVRGRLHTINWAKTVRDVMTNGKTEDVSLVEDRSQLDRGRMVLRLVRGKPPVLMDNVSCPAPACRTLLTS